MIQNIKREVFELEEYLWGGVQTKSIQNTYYLSIYKKNRRIQIAKGVLDIENSKLLKERDQIYRSIRTKGEYENGDYFVKEIPKWAFELAKQQDFEKKIEQIDFNNITTEKLIALEEELITLKGNTLNVSKKFNELKRSTKQMKQVLKLEDKISQLEDKLSSLKKILSAKNEEIISLKHKLKLANCKQQDFEKIIKDKTNLYENETERDYSHIYLILFVILDIGFIISLLR